MINLDTAKQGIMLEISDLLNLNAREVVSDPHAFWKGVALALSISEIEEDSTAMAKRVLDAIGEWDDDFVDEGGQLSIYAYEELLSNLKERVERGGFSDNTDGEDEPLLEDDIGPSLEFRVDYGLGQTTQPDIKTILGRIFDGDYILNPVWQRNFVWGPKKQRRFIESIMMGLPIPSLLLFRDPETAKVSVIDGRQRLETLARFCATPEERKRVTFLQNRFRAFSSNEPGWEEGGMFHDAAGKFFEKFPDLFHRKILNHPITIHTFENMPKKELYTVFQRYNTGADKLRPAEIRNAVYQETKLHKMMFRMAGETIGGIDYLDDIERDSAGDLRLIMKGKTARYGAYDFIGRVLAFTYLDTGTYAKTVAAASIDFMDANEDVDLENIRQNYFTALNAVLDWYRFPLTRGGADGKFHAFLGTIQMVSAHRMLQHIRDDRTSHEVVKSVIATDWPEFSQNTLKMKQNSGNFWQQQRSWLALLESRSLTTSS